VGSNRESSSCSGRARVGTAQAVLASVQLNLGCLGDDDIELANTKSAAGDAPGAAKICADEGHFSKPNRSSASNRSISITHPRYLAAKDQKPACSLMHGVFEIGHLAADIGETSRESTGGRSNSGRGGSGKISTAAADSRYSAFFSPPTSISNSLSLSANSRGGIECTALAADLKISAGSSGAIILEELSWMDAIKRRHGML
jgi:hypothetical protein